MSVLPEAIRPAVERALMSAFGTTVLDGALPMSGGLSGAGLWRIRVGGIAYVLRIEGARDAFRDPVRGYACMRIAAQAFLAPGVRYADPDDGVAIMDLIATRSLALDYPAPRQALIVDLAQSVRLLHRTPAFPPLVDYLDGMDALLDLFRGQALLAASATDELLDRYARLRATYRTAPGDWVSSHNDLNPGNVLYDGARLWLIDWESAFLADRYVDLASLATWFVRDAGAEETLLATYFGAPSTPDQRARLELMRQVNHLFYGVMFLNGAAAERPGVVLADRTLGGPGLASLREGLGAGAFSLQGWENRVAYGKARLAAALDGLRSPACAAALERVAAY